jgi:hypothetical protein
MIDWNFAIRELATTQGQLYVFFIELLTQNQDDKSISWPNQQIQTSKRRVAIQHQNSAAARKAIQGICQQVCSDKQSWHCLVGDAGGIFFKDPS